MRVLNASVVSDKEIWISVWEKWYGKEVFAHPNYLSLYLDEKSQACCALLETERGGVLYPFIKRSLVDESCYETFMGEIYDIVTAYGYGGGYVYGDADKNVLLKQFHTSFKEWTRQSGIVCEFIRFALDSSVRELYPGTVELNNDNVTVDLTVDIETMWHDFKHKVRKNVNKALGVGISVENDTLGESLDAFLKIYYNTMERRDADSRYYFSREYFEKLNNGMQGQFVYFHALYEKEVISTELILVSDNNIYSFLGGTKEEYFDLRPNDLLKFEIIKWGKEHGKKKFVLGGGYTPHDGIFNYKLAFAPSGICPFYVGKQVFIPEVYERLVNNKREKYLAEGMDFNDNISFFPLYRS